MILKILGTVTLSLLLLIGVCIIIFYSREEEKHGRK